MQFNLLAQGFYVNRFHSGTSNSVQTATERKCLRVHKRHILNGYRHLESEVVEVHHNEALALMPRNVTPVTTLKQTSCKLYSQSTSTLFCSSVAICRLSFNKPRTMRTCVLPFEMLSTQQGGMSPWQANHLCIIAYTIIYFNLEIAGG